VTPCSVVRGTNVSEVHGASNLDDGGSIRPLKRWYPTTILHGVTNQKTLSWFIILLRHSSICKNCLTFEVTLFSFSYDILHALYVNESRDSSVGIALGYGPDDRGSRVRFPAGAGRCLNAVCCLKLNRGSERPLDELA
jgi:hypothetical protein